MKNRLSKMMKSQNKTKLIVAVVATGIIGLVMLRLSYASVPTASLEPEAGKIAGTACRQSDSTASGGAAIKFACNQTANARRAADFTNSMGVVTHLNFPRYQDSAEVKAAMAYVGIPNVRTSSSRNNAAQLRKELAAMGVRFDFTTPTPRNSTAIPTEAEMRNYTDDRLDDIINNGLKNYTDSVEPFNEYDNPINHNNNPEWASFLRKAQAYLYNQTRARLGDNVDVLGPALRGIDMATSARQVGDISQITDAGNVHSYYGAQKPESSYNDMTKSFESSQQCTELNSDAGLDKRLAIAATCMTKTKPIVLTEMGYHNDPTTTDSARYTSELATSIYMPRAYLENFRIGIKRTYAYELLDDPGISNSFEQHFGMFDQYGAKKRSADVLHRFTTLLKDDGAAKTSFSPAQLDYTISGLSANTENIHQVLLQKSDGSHWLALWQGVSVWDYKAVQDLSPAAKAITLKLQNAANVTQYRPDTSVSGESLGKNTDFSLSIGPRVILLKIN